MTDLIIRRWIDEYSTLIEDMASTLRYTAGGRWNIDEKYPKTHPNGSKKKHWLVATICEFTGTILAFDITDTKFGHDATKLFEQAIAKTGRIPDVLASDKLDAYKKALENVIKIRNHRRCMWQMQA